MTSKLHNFICIVYNTFEYMSVVRKQHTHARTNTQTHTHDRAAATMLPVHGPRTPNQKM